MSSEPKLRQFDVCTFVVDFKGINSGSAATVLDILDDTTVEVEVGCEGLTLAVPIALLQLGVFCDDPRCTGGHPEEDFK